MEPSAGYFDLVNELRPGTRVEAVEAGKYMVVGLRCENEEVWIPLEYMPTSLEAEHLLAVVSNMMHCCVNCEGDSNYRCHHEHKVMANRLQRFLGPVGFQRFINAAPVATGSLPILARS